MMLTDDERKAYGVAMAEVQKHFPVPVLDPKWVALGALASVAFTINAGKLAAIQDRKKREARGERVPVSQNTSAVHPTAAEAPSWFDLANDIAPN